MSQNGDETDLKEDYPSQLRDSLRCQILLKLVLQLPRLTVIPRTIFEHMPLLELLDLSSTSIQSLPSSVSSLSSLKELLLRDCSFLIELPIEIGMLTKLKLLDLEGSEIMYIPKEIVELTDLEVLRLCLSRYAEYYIKAKNVNGGLKVPRMMISKLKKLKELCISVCQEAEWWEKEIKEIQDEICNLENLEFLKWYLPTDTTLKQFLDIQINKKPAYENLSNFTFTIGQHAQLTSCLPRDLEKKFAEFEKCLKWINAEGNIYDISKIMTRAKALFLSRHWTIMNLSAFDISKLKYLLLAECNEMETLIKIDDLSEVVENNKKGGLESLEYLSIHYMEKLKSIWEGPIGKDSLSRLRILALHTCLELTTIFTPRIAQNLSCLAELTVEECPKVRSLISTPQSEHGPLFPSLERIFLIDLPELDHIFGGLIVLEKLESLMVYNCVKLRRLSEMELPRIQKIIGENKWWNSLNAYAPTWENVFEPLKEKSKLIKQLLETTNSLQHFHDVVSREAKDEKPLDGPGLGAQEKKIEPFNFPLRKVKGRFHPLSVMSSLLRSEEVAPVKEEKSSKEKLSNLLSHIFGRNNELIPPAASNKSTELPEITETDDSEVSEDKSEEQLTSSSNFEELMKKLEEKDEGTKMPSNLPGGVMLDQMYAISPSELNSFIFSNDSDYLKQLAEAQGSTELQVGPWKFDTESGSLKRVFTYIKAPSRLIKALKAIEDQTYLKADGKCFSVLASVNTPDAPYASNYRVEIQTSISPGPELPSGEETSHLVVSWQMNFLHNTMMKGMIEGGARQGVKESFEQVATLLAEKLKVVDIKNVGSEKDQALASLQIEKQSDWKLAVQYFCNFTVISTIFMGLYVLVHLFLAMPNTIQGLEFGGLDLPDSIGEVVVCGFLVLQAERVMKLISRFMQARGQKGGDHGVKAQGDGWLLTVALVEGSNLPAVESNALSDPYVVFTCNGKARTSSIKFQKSDPRWNEIFEFDAMDDPPSTLDVEVYDFDGPFDEAVSLGHAQINFVKTNISDLGDAWVPLEGKLAQACQSKLHLRIFLNNTRGSNIVKEYLTKMEKEVGKKIKMRSPQTNSAFQKLFKLPPEEFLINDFTCHLKRRMPLQGRLFLSARIIGFHGDLFGHKTTFFFLWEDIEDIQVVPPTLSSMGSLVVVITLHPGRGLDAKHGAKTQDEEGRLKFHFQSFVSFSVAHRTIVALWRARSLSPEQKGIQMLDEESSLSKSDDESENRSLQSEESGSLLGLEDVSLSVVYSSVLSAPLNFVMELFSGSELERRAMDRAHCVNYSTSPWEVEKPDVYQRQTYYKFDISVSRYGGEVTTSQQKSRLTDRNGWLVEEVTTLHGVPLGDYFTLHTKYQIEDQGLRSMGCKVVVHFGIAWLKNTKHKKKITKNIHANLQDRMIVMFSTIEKEFVSGKQKMQS